MQDLVLKHKIARVALRDSQEALSSSESLDDVWKVDASPSVGQLAKLADSQFNFILFLPFQAASALWGTTEGRPLLSKHNTVHSWGETREEQVHH